MILITGAAGFIGSALVWKLNDLGFEDIIISDKFHDGNKWKNLRKRTFYDFVDRDNLFEWLETNGKTVDIIVHMGACSATTEMNMDFLIKNNYEYSKKLFEYCLSSGTRFIYASSAATYGLGEDGYDDNDLTSLGLRPLNPYGYSKQLFDLWVLKQEDKPLQWAGLKFFNVYGPNEYHKGRMASVAFHAFNQAKSTGKINLFKSYKDEYEDGWQLRDFIYVKDVVNVINFFVENNKVSGIYNLGTGKARSFFDLATNTMSAMEKKPHINYIEMPEDIRDKYQYFTEANVSKLRKAGYRERFFSIEDGITDYVQNYLMKNDIYL